MTACILRREARYCIIDARCQICHRHLKIYYNTNEQLNNKLKHPRKFCSSKCYKQYRQECAKPKIAKVPRSEPLVGTRTITKYGYVNIRGDDNRWHPEHRVVMERMLGRSLKQYESVHHRDGHRANNSEDNLELWLSAHRNGVRASDITCPHCGKSYFPVPKLL